MDVSDPLMTAHNRVLLLGVSDWLAGIWFVVFGVRSMRRNYLGAAIGVRPLLRVDRRQFIRDCVKSL